MYDSAKLVQSRIVDEKTHGVFEDFNKNLVIMDPLMYEAKYGMQNLCMQMEILMSQLIN